MKTFIDKISGSHPASASVVDGKLILSFPGAIKPVVWQMDLDKTKASALEVQEQNGGFSLVLKTPKGENMDIAPFDDRNKAVEGLMAASRAIENAYGNIHPHAVSNENTPNYSAPESQKSSKFWPVLISILLIMGLFWFWNIVSVNTLTPHQLDNTASLTSGSSGYADQASQAGVPVSADDFLQGR